MKFNFAVLSIFMTAIMLLVIATQAVSQPRKVTKQDLNELRNGKVPKNAKKFQIGGKFVVTIYTPRGRAAKFASFAADNYIKLDSINYNPDMFNKHIEIVVVNLSLFVGMIDGFDDVLQISRGIILHGDEVNEADNTVFVEKNLQNLLGASCTNIDATFYFPLSLFTGEDDLKLVIFYNDGKKEHKIKKKDIKKLE
jgi:hypothetical protein